MKKFYLSCAALLMAATFSALGQNEPPKDSDGSYLISNANELKWFRDKVNSSKHEAIDSNGDGKVDNMDETVVPLSAKLTADIDLGGEPWVPIGEYNNGEEPDELRFGGVFDGQGHVIKGLNVQPIDGRQSYGLFGYVAWGVVKNLGIEGGTVTSKPDNLQEYAGAISGMLSYGRIENCFSTATVKGTEEGSIGGLTGGMRKISTVANSYNAGEVIDPAGCAGGITGYIGSSAGVYNCYNLGKVAGGAISGDEVSGAALRSGEEELLNILECYYLEGCGEGIQAKALKAEAFVATINDKLFTDPGNGTDFPWQGKASLTDGKLSVPTYSEGQNIVVDLEGGSTANEAIGADEVKIEAASGVLRITVPEAVEARIVDLSGRVVRTLRLAAGTHEVTGMASGVYVVMLSEGTCAKVAF